MESTPTVSVVMPTFNTRACVGAAIDSALAQDDVPVEVIVVDDASEDGTADFVADRYAGDPRVRVLRCEKNGGPAAARNIGFRAATGTWIALLDSDDFWKPGRLKKLLLHEAQADFIADNILGLDVVAGKETGPLINGMPEGALRLVDFVIPTASHEHDLGYLQPLLRRSFLLDNKLFYREDVRVGEDLLLNVEFLAAGGRAYYVPEPLYVYATPVGSVSGSASPHSRSNASTEPMIDALQDIWNRLSSQLSQAENDAFRLRLETLRREAPIAAFHRARASGDYGEMLRLFLRERAVRGKIFERLIRTLSPGTRCQIVILAHLATSYQ